MTDSNGLQAVASTTLVPKLTISQVTVSPASPASGNPFGIEVTVRNDGGVPITSVAPQVSIAPGTVATVDTGPTPASADLAAGTQATFDFAATALAGGDATATVDASGAGPGGPVSAGQRQTDLTVGGDLLPLDLTVDSSDIGVGGTTAVHVHVTNGTGHSITGLAPTLTVTPTSGVTLGGPTGGATTLVAGDDATFDYTLTATQAATLSLDAGASATVPFDGSAVQSVHQTTQLDVGAPTIVVNSTGDEQLPAAAKTARSCDVDPATSGDQCTLRAAIELANAWVEVGKVVIDFNVNAGGAAPTIAPASPLPPVTKTVTIDGTTQPGGWVELTGANAGANATGIALGADASVVRGLVVNLWDENGILVTGQGSVIAGNRIGTESPASLPVRTSTG